MVFAEDGQMRNDVHGRDIGSDNDDGERVRDVGGGGGRVGRFAERFDDFLDAAAERFGLCG